MGTPSTYSITRYKSPLDGHSAIQQPGNIRMLQSGKYLPFLAKSLLENAGRKGQVNQFDGDLLLELAIGAMRQIDGAHAATPQQAIQHVGANLAGFESEIRAPLPAPPGEDAAALFRLAGIQNSEHTSATSLWIPIASASTNSAIASTGAARASWKIASMRRKLSVVSTIGSLTPSPAPTLNKRCVNRRKNESYSHGIPSDTAVHAPEEPALDEFQIAIHGGLGDLHQGRGFLGRATKKVA